ncbi:phosphonoacetate hydrolase [Niabella drilacis]|uniref:Phosphonoacetate hydrolase n=1 Tax=Niabella drilacis (strain DSM 25811 / CCM 8410 / CCUG 62505 / LMG 26954 / E90) TaxID=1285928 RepID=A0A1G6R9K0_NIADE|nr:phosphonoacetate hydrolase [Niabella drilacis]SDD00974.1 phosphonoacetate hydrolase [Niabella drilacis]
MDQISTTSFSVNGITYTPQQQPIVVICMDGSADEYYNAALTRDKMPCLKAMIRSGYRGLVRGALPSFTNVNNTSIVTGLPPSAHGICGNFFYDEKNDMEVMMNSAEYLRAGTILAAAAASGRKVAVVTAKEKLRDILSHQLKGIAFSAERASDTKLSVHGIEQAEQTVGLNTPEIYSADASLFVLRAGVALIEKGMADFLYLSLTDYMQHTYAPEAPEALDFYAAIDTELGRLLSLGARIGATPDHGMNPKITAGGKPNVLYVEDLLEAQFGSGFRVICPITDPYVKHHGALGSYVVIHIEDKSIIQEVIAFLHTIPGITEVYNKEEAVRHLEQPSDRTGDVVVLSGRNVVVGRKPRYHDLNAIEGALRSHGGRYEEMISMILSHPLNNEYLLRSAGDPRNFQIFDFLINGTK